MVSTPDVETELKIIFLQSHEDNDISIFKKYIYIFIVILNIVYNQSMPFTATF